MQEIEIDKVIAILNRLKEKNVKKIQYKGTVMCEEDDNCIILTTEPQW